MNCKNCGEPIDLPPPRRPKITLFNFTGFFEGLFSEVGIIVLLIVCCIGLPVIFGVGSKDEEYSAIKKALETPGIKVEVTKDGEGKVGWKIVKEAELLEKKK